MKRLIIYLFTIMITMISCGKDWLTPAPENTIIGKKSVYDEPNNAVQFVTSVYSQLNEWSQHSFSWIGVSSITSDNADKGSDPGDLGSDKNLLDNFAYTPTTPSINETWVANFIGVGRANQAISNVPKFANVEESLKNRLVAESKFLRSYYYFNLVRMFGDVPKIIQAFDSDSVEQIVASYSRIPEKEIYALLEQDLTEASEELPNKSTYTAADVGRASKGAALGQLAKVYMYQKKWQESLAAAEKVINSGEYSLETDYAAIWRQSSENGRESLFEVQGQNGLEGWGTGGYTHVQGIRGTVTNGYSGWGFNTPSEDLEKAYEPGDPRKLSTIIFAGQTLWDGAKVSSNVANKMYNYKAYVSQTKEINYDDWSTGKNIRILRYAEVLLIAAEAANELNQSTKAMDYLNLVRKRARGNQANILPDIKNGGQTELRKAIWQERRMELAMEHDRFFDLVRQGRAGTVLRAHGKAFVDGKHEHFPIPLDQIIISQGKLVQNKGY